MVKGLTSNVSYEYDSANRLTTAGGQAYTFDANGNLLSDGTSTYTYDSANRLTSVSNQSTVSSYQYSGLGDRLSQTVNGVPTNYTLDLNTGLTQVLSDGTTSYTYGLGRISQTSTTTEYFLGDALGSVRQLTNNNGEIILAKSYDPYGNVAASTGNQVSMYGYSGEQTDSSGMVYLRSRYYSPANGRFQSRDTWGGDVNSPMSMNRWVYVEGNPVNRVDPSGYCYGGSFWDLFKEPLFEPCSSENGQVNNPLATQTPAPPTKTPDCPTPTFPPTLTPTATTPPYPAYSNPNARMFLDAVLKHQNELRPGFSVALLLAMGSWESGHQHNWSNSTVQGGVLQLRKESGHLSMPQGYPDTPEGYEQNVVDAIAVINGYYDKARNSEGWLFDFLYTETYPNNPNEVTAARSVLYYNGDIGWWKDAYINHSENIPYVRSVAGELNYVSTFFGYRDDIIEPIMYSVQHVVDCQMNPASCK